MITIYLAPPTQTRALGVVSYNHFSKKTTVEVYRGQHLPLVLAHELAHSRLNHAHKSDLEIKLLHYEIEAWALALIWIGHETTYRETILDCLCSYIKTQSDCNLIRFALNRLFRDDTP